MDKRHRNWVWHCCCNNFALGKSSTVLQTMCTWICCTYFIWTFFPPPSFSLIDFMICHIFQTRNTFLLKGWTIIINIPTTLVRTRLERETKSFLTQILKIWKCFRSNCKYVSCNNCIVEWAQSVIVISNILWRKLINSAMFRNAFLSIMLYGFLVCKKNFFRMKFACGITN